MEQKGVGERENLAPLQPLTQSVICTVAAAWQGLTPLWSLAPALAPHIADSSQKI